MLLNDKKVSCPIAERSMNPRPSTIPPQVIAIPFFAVLLLVDHREKKKEFHSECGSGKIEGIDTMIIFPNTFMNNSGLAVVEAMKFYNTNPEDLIVVHDEIELPFGEIRTKSGGGHKGHNGIRSIIQHIGSPDFNRVRIGVGRPENPKIEVADYLLSDFTDDELTKIKDLAPQITQEILTLINRSS